MLTRFARRKADSTVEDGGDKQSPGTDTQTELRRALLTALVVVSTYYVARVVGLSEVGALMAGAAVSATRLTYSLVRNRRFDPVACFLLAMDGSTVIVGLWTQSPRLMLVSHQVPGTLVALFFIGGAVLNKPVTELIVSWLRPGSVQQHIAEHHWTDGDARAYRRMHMRLTRLAAALQAAHLAAAVPILILVPVDISRALLAAIAIGTALVIIVVTLLAVGRFLQRHETSQASAVDGAETEHDNVDRVAAKAKRE